MSMAIFHHENSSKETVAGLIFVPQKSAVEGEKAMQIDLDTWLASCGSEVQSHNRRTGQLIRALLTEVGRGELIKLWRLNQNGPCDYHDIGKRATDTDPLRHCSRGAALFSQAYEKALDGRERIFYSIACDLCRYHHERWDGTGGPEHLSEDDIPIIARAGAVADAWDYLDTQKPQLSQKEKLQCLKAYAGTWYDPELVAALERLFPVQPVE